MKKSAAELTASIGSPASPAALGEHAGAGTAWAAWAAIDDNRYVKLRRIAIENLASIL